MTGSPTASSICWCAGTENRRLARRRSLADAIAGLNVVREGSRRWTPVPRRRSHWVGRSETEVGGAFSQRTKERFRKRAWFAGCVCRRMSMSLEVHHIIPRSTMDPTRRRTLRHSARRVMERSAGTPICGRRYERGEITGTRRVRTCSASHRCPATYSTGFVEQCSTD